MKIGRGLLDVGQLVLYHGKQLLIIGVTKTWAAAQWILNAALNANPIGIIILLIAAAVAACIALYNHWEDLKKWWDSWTLKDVFADLKVWADDVIKDLKGKWQDFKNWLQDLLTFGWSKSIKETESMQKHLKDHPEDMEDIKNYYSTHYANGGFINSPEVALIGEAGREVVIPLERQSRGTELWLEAGRELGLLDTAQNISNLTNNYNNVPSAANGFDFTSNLVRVIQVLNNSNSSQNSSRDTKILSMNGITNNAGILNNMPFVKAFAHADGGIFNTPHIGLVAEAGREAVIPLEDQSRGIPLWIAAGQEMGMTLAGSSVRNSINNSVNNSRVNNNLTQAPVINITINGGTDEDIAERVRIAVEDALRNIQTYEERVSFV